MVKPGQKTKKKRYKKTPGGNVKAYFERERHGKASCALCGNTLAGVPNQDKIKKLSKTKRRPSAIFAGVLCNRCRSTVLEEAIKIKENIKKVRDCKITLIPYIEQALKLLE